MSTSNLRVVVIGAGIMGATAARTDETDGVRVIDHHQRLVLLRQVADGGEVRNVTVHREHAVRGDHLETRLARLIQPGFKLRHVVVRVAETLRLTKTHTIND